MSRFLLIALLSSFAVSVYAQSLGDTTFPNSGAEEAQEPFMRGLLLLHSFEYDHAREAFQEAKEADPEFAMAYWGEAQTHNHPIWQDQDRGTALSVLAEMPDDARTTASERERAYLAALDVLYGDGEKEDRDDAFAAAMGELAAAYPDDENAATFHALAILGTAHEGRDLETYGRAGEIALAAFEQNSRHPGAAHYTIHAYDDPLNAENALEAAQAYSEIAPDAPHALHMPTHIYFALGMWDESAELNRRSYEAARRRDEAAGQPLGGHGWHPLFWLHYGELQRGRFEEARRLFDEALELAESGQSSRGWSSVISMRAHELIEMRGVNLPTLNLDVNLELLNEKALHVNDFSDALSALVMKVRDRSNSQMHEDAFEVLLGRMRSRIESELVDDAASRIMVLQLEAWKLRQSDMPRALELLDEAVALEDAMPLDFGPPSPAWPTHELRGEWLLQQSGRGQNLRERLHHAVEAQAEFEQALARAPMRLRSLRGLREAAIATGDDNALAVTEDGLCRAMRSTDNALLQQQMLIGTVPGSCRSAAD